MEGVGAMVESGWEMTGKSDADDGQHQTSEREQSIHDVGGGGSSLLVTMTDCLPISRHDTY